MYMFGVIKYLFNNFNSNLQWKEQNTTEHNRTQQNRAEQLTFHFLFLAQYDDYDD